MWSVLGLHWSVWLLVYCAAPAHTEVYGGNLCVVRCCVQVTGWSDAVFAFTEAHFCAIMVVKTFSPITYVFKISFLFGSAWFCSFFFHTQCLFQLHAALHSQYCTNLYLLWRGIIQKRLLSWSMNVSVLSLFIWLIIWSIKCLKIVKMPFLISGFRSNGFNCH